MWHLESPPPLSDRCSRMTGFIGNKFTVLYYSHTFPAVSSPSDEVTFQQQAVLITDDVFCDDITPVIMAPPPNLSNSAQHECLDDGTYKPCSLHYSFVSQDSKGIIVFTLLLP